MLSNDNERETALRALATELLDHIDRGGDPVQALQNYIEHPLNKNLRFFSAGAIDMDSLDHHALHYDPKSSAKIQLLSGSLPNIVTGADRNKGHIPDITAGDIPEPLRERMGREARQTLMILRGWSEGEELYEA